MEKYKYYNSLLSFSYLDLVEFLNKKYGRVTDDYFKEKSYTRFLNGEIKTPAKGKYSRTSEGLYCHHVFENKYENISNPDFIRIYQYPYDLQRKSNLVYCDLIEHLILHALIMKDTNGEFGTQGFLGYIRPMVVEWYIDRNANLKRDWYIAVYKRAFLYKDEATKILKDIDLILLEYAKDTIQYRVDREQRELQQKEEQEQADRAEFNEKYPNLKQRSIPYNISRRDIVKLLKTSDVEGDMKSFKEYYSSLNEYLKDELLERLDEMASKD